MTKKFPARLLSAILTLAICATTVFGCLMTVNAAGGPSYVIAEETLKKYATGGTTTVTFNVTDGMSAGVFTVDGDWYESVTVAFDSGTNKNGAYSGADDFEIEVSKEDDNPAVVVFRINNSQNETLTNANGEVDPKLYSTVTFSLSFVFTAPIIANIDVTISYLDFVGIYAEDIYVTKDFDATSGMFLAGCPHTYVVDTSADSLLYSESGSYSVYQKAECSKCGEIIEGYQVLPESAGNTTTYEWSLLAVNITYNPDGSTNLNFHYDAVSEAENVYLYVPTSTESDKAKFQKITEPTASSYAGTTYNDMAFSENAKMFTIKNLSARDIDLLWLPTIVVEYEDGTLAYGKTEQISIEEYATQVILGEATYPTSDSADEEKKQLDKDVAAALINYGYAADAALNVKGITSDEAGATLEWDGEKTLEVMLLDTSAANSEANPYIIENPKQLFAMVRCECTYNGNTIDTNGAYFKIADGIDAFYMNGGETVANLTSAAEVKAWFENSANSKSQWWKNGKFCGSFDGNGITIYGLYCTQRNAGLFPEVDGITIKNTTIKNSYFAANDNGTAATGNVGAFIGNVTWVSGDVYGDIAMEQIASINNYIESSSKTGSDVYGPGAIAGNLRAAKYSITNCLVYGNEYNNLISDVYDRLVSYGGTKNTATIQNIIAIDAAPYTNQGGWYAYGADTGVFKNIFTTMDISADPTVGGMGSYSATTAAKFNLNTLTAAQMTGTAAMTNMSALDWENTWAYGLTGEYPTIAGPNSSNVKAVSEYSGTPDTALAGSGTETDPYIIKTADQFAAVALGKIDGVTENTYYEVDRSVKAFYMHGGVAVADLTDVDAVKDYFEKNGSITTNSWQITAAFQGHLDGNGVVISGLYAYVKDADQWVAAALFPQVLGHSSIKNITLKNSYISAKHAQGNVAAIVGGTQHNSSNDSDTSNSITLENIEIINNYVSSRHTTSDLGASILAGYIYDRNYLDANNILIYGNEIDNSAYENTDDDAEKERRSRSGFVTVNSGTGWSGAPTDAQKNSKIKNVICLGSNPWAIGYDGTSYSTAGWNMANMNVGVIKNVYTDQSLDILIEYTKSRNEANNSDTVFAQQNIVKVAAEDMQGASAKTVATVLAWDTTWFAGANNDYPSFSEPTKLTSALQSKYDALTLGNYDNYAVTEATSRDCYMYASSLNLKVNPYIAFTFAFRGDYAANKASVKVTLTTADGKEYITTAAEMVNNTDPDNFAGRYHLYRFKDVPVEYLCKDISVKVEYEGKTTQLGTFSVEGFALDAYNANRIMPSLYYSTRAEAAKALLFYTQMINARYGA